jgi:apolipoprotein N-acyltransferase
MAARAGLHPLWLAAATGGLLWLCYFPAAWGFLGWVALVPLLCLVRLPRRRGLYWSAFAGGLLFTTPALQWMRIADPRMYATWLFMSFYCALYFPLTLFLVRRSRLPLVLTLPVVWTALEYLRCTFGTGFGWYLLGHSQHDALAFIQISDLTGAYGVSFILAAANALLFEVLYSLDGFRKWLCGAEVAPRWSRTALLAQGLGVAALVMAAGGYGIWRLHQQDFAAGPTVALIQGNLDQRIRSDSDVSHDAGVVVADHYFHISDVAARWFDPDLIIWPETSWPFGWTEIQPGRPAPNAIQQAKIWSDRWKTFALLGLNAYIWEDGKERRYNSALLIDPDGQPRGRYDKIHRVPFGEYVPFRDWLPWMNALAPYDHDYSVWPGQDFTRFALPARAGKPATTFGVLICYEDTDADVSRPYGGGDGRPAADFVLNISNDGWFNGTFEHDQHLAICRFRAVENRRPVARSVNMGISAIIDGNGRVLAPQALRTPPGLVPADLRVWRAEAAPGAASLPISQWGQYKKVPGVLLGVIPLDGRFSFYAHWGDWLPWTCAVLAMGGLVWSFRRSP